MMMTQYCVKMKQKKNDDKDLKKKEVNADNSKVYEAHRIRRTATEVRKKNDRDELENEAFSLPTKKQKRRNSSSFFDFLKQTEGEELAVMKEELEHRRRVNKRQLDFGG